jgi:rhomboid protease GluP
LVNVEQSPVRLPAKRVTLRSMIVASIAVVICVVIFLGISSESDRTSWAALAHWGVLPSNAIYDGNYWALVSSAFAHADAWHLLSNLPWLWIFGNRLERAVGWWRWIAFIFGAAFVSSALQLIVTDSSGIGASGIVYALAGFLWIAREHYPQFKQVLMKRTLVLFLIWLVAGFGLTASQLLNIGNVAHISGLVFGALIAAHNINWRTDQMVRASMVRAGIALLIAAAVVPLFYAPWSVVWLSNQAYHAHVDRHYAEALSYYDRIIALNPHDAWAFVNGSRLYQAIGESEKAASDFEHAAQLDPSIAQEE